MLKSETREIGGKHYCVTQLAAEPGQFLFFQLVKFAGPSVAALLNDWRGEGATVDAGTVGKALSELTSQLTYETFRKFVDTFIDSTVVIGGVDANGNEIRQPLSKSKALAFAGDYGSLVKWLGFCLEVNYASFFADMGLTKLPSSPASS